MERTRNEEKWFYRGREARGLGKPRELPDARLSVASRQQFYAGWDEEERLRQPAPPPAQVTEAHDVLDRLKQFARTLKTPAAAP